MTKSNEFDETVSRLYSLLNESLDSKFTLSEINFTNWDILYDTLLQQKIFPIGYSLLKKHLPQAHKVKWDSAYIFLQIITEQRLVEIQNIQHIFKSNHIPSCLAKGVALSQQIYNTPYARQFNDIDIYVDDDHFNDAIRCLLKEGYRSELSEWLPAGLTFDAEKFFADIADVVFLPQDNRQYKIEIKKADPGAFFDEHLVKHSISTTSTLFFRGNSIITFEDDIGLFYLLTNAYKNNLTPWGKLNSRNIRDIYDIASWIERNPQYNYTRFLDMITRSKILGYLQEILSLVASIFVGVREKIPQSLNLTAMDAEEELRKIFDINYRNNEYYKHVLSYIESSCFHLIPKNCQVAIECGEIIPIKGFEPTVTAQRMDNESISLVILGFPTNIELYFNILLYEKNKDGFPQNPKKIFFKKVENNIEIVDSEIDFIPLPQVIGNHITIFIPIIDRILFPIEEKDGIPFSLAIFWSKVQYLFNSWMSIGGDFFPHVLVID